MIELEIKNNKVIQFKVCLKTFGYRKLNEDIMVKPIAFMMINVEILSDKAIFKLFFRNHENQTLIFSSREFEFTKDKFETSEQLSYNIAAIEQDICSHYSPFLTSSAFPWNFHTSIDYIDI